MTTPNGTPSPTTRSEQISPEWRIGGSKFSEFKNFLLGLLAHLPPDVLPVPDEQLEKLEGKLPPDPREVFYRMPDQPSEFEVKKRHLVDLYSPWWGDSEFWSDERIRARAEPLPLTGRYLFLSNRRLPESRLTEREMWFLRLPMRFPMNTSKRD